MDGVGQLSRAEGQVGQYAWVPSLTGSAHLGTKVETVLVLPSESSRVAFEVKIALTDLLRNNKKRIKSFCNSE